MNANDRQRLLVTLAGVYGFYGSDLTEFAISVWVDVADEFEPVQFDRAMKAHLRDPSAGRWLPKPADIIRQLRGDQQQAGVLAWSDVLACARAGGAGYPALPDTSKNALESVGGMGMLRRADEQQTGHIQRQFLAAHQAYVGRDTAQQNMVGAEQWERLQ